jgi:hypothetical protein
MNELDIFYDPMGIDEEQKYDVLATQNYLETPVKIKSITKSLVFLKKKLQRRIGQSKKNFIYKANFD